MDTLPELDLSSLPGPDTIVRRETGNGIVLLARENFSSPSVVLTGYLRAGALSDPPAQAGLADLTAGALMRGTRARDFDEIHESIESIGARLHFSAGKHSTVFSGKSLAEDIEVLVDLLADCVQAPSFPKAQVDRLRSERLTGLAIRDQETRAQAGMAFSRLIYGVHPYAVPTDGYKDTISELTSTDLRRFHRNQFGPQGMVVCVVGGIEAERAFTTIEKRLAGWSPKAGNGAVDLPPVSAPVGIQREHVKLEGKSQSDVVMGYAGPPRSDPDFVTAALANNILGRFGMYGRIGDVVREEAGLAYYAYSTLVGGHGPGPWEVIAGVNPANMEQAIELIRGELRKISTDPPTRRELFENQSNFIGRLPLQLESNEGVAGAIVNAERHNLGLDYYRRYPELVAGVTRGEILRVSQRFIDADNLAIATAGERANGR